MLMKTKERLSNCSRLKVTKESRNLYATLGSGFTPFAMKDIAGTMVKREWALRTK